MTVFLRSAARLFAASDSFLRAACDIGPLVRPLVAPADPAFPPVAPLDPDCDDDEPWCDPVLILNWFVSQSRFSLTAANAEAIVRFPEL